MLMKQDIVNSDSPCAVPPSYMLFSSQCSPHHSVSPCFAQMTLSSDPVLQLSEEELQILCCLQHIDTLNRAGDRMNLLLFDTKLMKATQIFLLTSFICMYRSSVKAKVSFACLEKHHATLPLKLTAVKRYHVYYILICKNCCSSIKANQRRIIKLFFWKQFAYTQHTKTQMGGGKEPLGSCIQSF